MSNCAHFPGHRAPASGATGESKNILRRWFANGRSFFHIHTQAMSILGLGTYKLPAAEVVLVQMLVRLLGHGDAFRWRFVTEPPYDALLVDGAAVGVNNTPPPPPIP